MIELLDDPAQFGARAQPLLSSTVRNTVPATVLDSIRTGRFPNEGWQFALVTDASGSVIGAALRTPPRPMLCTALREPDAAELMTAWLTVDPDLPGVNADTRTVRALVAAHHAQTGGRAELTMEMALHAVAPDELRDPPRPAAGRLRRPHAAEHDRVAEWYVAFVAESEIEEAEESARRSARLRIERGLTFVWDDGGEPVSLVGHTVRVAGVPRVGPVYTPPEHRSRGYASTAVAALTGRLFAEGASAVVLFTDLSNPTSNRIYRDVGYRRLADYEQHALRR